MTTSSATNRGGRTSFLRRWPATTACGLAGLLALAASLAQGGATAPALDDEVEAEEFTDEEVLSGAVHRGEEGKMGRATARAKSGLYAMKGPKDAATGAFAVGSDDGDVWGGLKGAEIGEGYGVGGLGLVGTGRGGGGSGTIGLGADAGGGRYDASLQSGRLTAGVVDDNADPAGYRKAMARLDAELHGLGLDDQPWAGQPPPPRHAAAPGGLDVALVIDTTGSMGDELEYLKVEIRDIARQISREFPGVDQRWGMVVYRDVGDDYVTRHADFQDIERFVEALGRQKAGGGGDMPEAMDAAMDASSRLSWRAGQGTARMVFLVADAPSHAGAEAGRFASEVHEHRRAGTAVYPVASSGVDGQAEAQMRFAAKATGGQYIFLTDHSGVGGEHARPQVDQFKVESLRAVMTRMIRGELGDARDARVQPGAPVVCNDAPAAPWAPLALPVDPIALSGPVEPPVAVADVWDELKERLAAHFLFASSVALIVLAAMGFDTLLRRGRRG
jgi:hypothetical protein